MTDPLSILRPASKERADKVMLTFYTALDDISSGRSPGESEWRSLADAINTVETLTLHQRKLVKAEVMPTIQQATEAMVDAAKQFERAGVIRVSGPGLQALRDVVDIYGQCCEALTEREMALAQAETQRRVHALQRAKRPANEVVML
ncbi:MAG: hypothetical protein ACRCV9_19570 [Burkholderiaceae bacterium]